VATFQQLRGFVRTHGQRPTTVAIAYCIAATGTSVGVAALEGRLFSAENGVDPLVKNLSTMIDFFALNPIVIYFLLVCQKQINEVHKTIKDAKYISKHDAAGIVVLSIVIGLSSMKYYIDGFYVQPYWDSTLISANDVPVITKTGWIIFLWTGLFISIISYASFRNLFYVIFLVRMNVNDIPYKPIHYDNSGGLKFLVEPCLSYVYSMIFIAIIFIVFVIQDKFVNRFDGSNRLDALAIYAPVVIILFGIPVLKLHNLMVERNRQIITGLTIAFEREYEACVRAESCGSEEQHLPKLLLEYFEKYKKLVSELPSWPLPVKSAATPVGTVLASLSPLAEKGLSYIVENIDSMIQ